jgi:hypothetical protein
MSASNFADALGSERLWLHQSFMIVAFLGSLWRTKSDAFSSTIVLDEFNASAFQRSAQCGFVSEGHGDFSINDFRPTDSCYANF